MAKAKWKRRRKACCAFYDLNLSTEGVSQAERASILTTALQLGYSAVAFNHIVKGSLSDACACRSRSLDISAIAAAHPEVAQSAHFHRDVLGVPPAGRVFRQYDRLTAIVDSAIEASALNAGNPVLLSYDMVAIRPTVQKVFDQACTHLEVDLISLDFLHRLPIQLKPSSIQAALDRGVFFEISFSGTFYDIKARRELLANMQVLQRLTRGKNIIVTSGAGKAMDLRGPNDVANMATLFGLSREDAKHSVSRNCEEAIVHGLARKRAYKSAVIVEKIPAWEQRSADETWFEVPKEWDPMRKENEFFLPQKTTSFQFEALHKTAELEQHEEEDTGKNTDLGHVPPFAEAHLDCCAENVSNEDKDEAFLSINLLNSPETFGVGNFTGGKLGFEKQQSKSKKRKKKPFFPDS